MPTPATRSPISSELIFDLPAVGAPALSPDGQTVAYVASRTSRETMSAESHIRLVAFDGGGDRQLTAGPRDGSPVWSPDGSQLAFLRAADDAAPRQIWLLPTDGGEARRLTNLPHAVESCTWTPDGRTLIAVVDVNPERLLPDDGQPRTRVIRNLYYRGDALGYRVDAYHHLFRIDANSGEATQLTRGAYNNAHPVVSPNGRWIAFASDRSPQRQRRRPFGSELCLMPIGGGDIERLTPGVQSAGRPAWSPNGRALAVAVTETDELQQAYLCHIDRRSRKRRRLTDDSLTPQSGAFPLAPPPPIRWTDEGIVFAADARARSGVWRVAADGHSEPEPLRAEAEVIAAIDISPDGARIAAVVTTPNQPGELVAQRVGEPAQRLTSATSDFLAAHRPARVEWFEIERDGLTIPAGLMFPPDFDPAQRYPLLLDIHGGPHGVFTESFQPLHQTIAGAGYLVLFVNPRGTSTYGSDFTHAVVDDWGGEDSLDLLAALDAVCERPYVDPERLAVHGYSYGGYMTSWLIGHTKRFKAAIVGAPVINLESMYGATDIAVSWARFEWRGRPADSPDWYRERSPLTYAPNVATPVLLMHGEADFRCPISQSEEYFVALRDRGKRVELVRFPDCAHPFIIAGHPKMRQEYYDRLVAWLNRYLRR